MENKSPDATLGAHKNDIISFLLTYGYSNEVVSRTDIEVKYGETYDFSQFKTVIKFAKQDNIEFDEMVKLKKFIMDKTQRIKRLTIVNTL